MADLDTACYKLSRVRFAVGLAARSGVTWTTDDLEDLYGLLDEIMTDMGWDARPLTKGEE